MKTTKATRKTAASESPEEVDPAFAPVVQAFMRDRAVTRGKMFGSIGLKVGGKVFAMFVKGKFVAKLPAARVDALVASGAGYFDPGHGRPMKEWVAMAANKGRWVDLAREARDFVAGGDA